MDQNLASAIETLIGGTLDSFVVCAGAGVSVVTRTAAQVRTMLSINNLDNTSDVNKPVSTAQATADALRVLKAGDTMTGALNLPSAIVTGSGGVQLESTAALPAHEGFTLYSTADKVTNYQRLRVNVTAANIVTYDVQKGGSGATGYHSFRVNSTAVMDVDASQTIFVGNLFLSPDNVKTIGRLSTSPFRPKDVYVGTGLQVGAAANTAIAGTIHAVSTGVGVVTLICQAFASQTANKFESRASGGTVEAFIAPGGTISTIAGIACGAVTYAVLNATAAALGSGAYRVSDRANRWAYPDGTNWRWFGDDVIIS